MNFDFYPYNQPSFKEKIILPEDKKNYIKEYFNKNYYLENDNFEDINIDLDKLIGERTTDDSAYTLEELKEFGKQLNIEKVSGTNKKELIKKIKMKLKLI